MQNQLVSYLFLFTIGPVQSYISQSRKTRDLYASSQILSNLIKEAMQEVGAANIIFPYPEAKFVPNRFIALVEKPAEDIGNFGKQIEIFVRQRFEEKARNVLMWNRLKISNYSNYNQDFENNYFAQIQQHLEVYWVFKKIDGDTYSSADYAYLERIMGAVKVIRPFEQYVEMGRKCSLDGQRNALFFGKGSNRNYLKGNKAIELDEKVVRIKHNEGLSAVGFMKRFYHAEQKAFQKFPSTTKVALLKDIDAAKSTKNIALAADILNYKGLFYTRNENLFDEELFFEDNLTEYYFKKNGLKSLLHDLPKIKKQHEKIKPYLQTKYYAVLIFDGDDMGKWMEGEYLPVEKQANIQTYHKELSTCLSNFAKKAEEIVDTNYGQTVYAGGDDFLGLVNLFSLFEILQALRQEFKVQISHKIQSFLSREKALTFSAGICIAHYKEPLHLVLAKAREMQEKAKKRDDIKDSVWIGVIKGSGRQHEMTFSHTNKEGQYNAVLVDRIIKRLASSEFSSTFIRNLQLEFAPLYETIAGSLLVEKPLLNTEIKRLVWRSCQIEGSKEKKKAASEEFADALIKFYIQDDLIDKFFDMLNICDFIAKQPLFKTAHRKP